MSEKRIFFGLLLLYVIVVVVSTLIHYTRSDECVTKLEILLKQTQHEYTETDVLEDFDAVVEVIGQKYADIYHQYDTLCNVSGILYVFVGSTEDGMMITIRKQGANHKWFDYIPVYQPVLNTSSRAYKYLYTANNTGHIDCFVVPIHSTAASAIPVLHARDIDRCLAINKDNKAIMKYIHLNTCVINNRPVIYSVHARMDRDSSGYTETFIVDSDVHKYYTDNDMNGTSIDFKPAADTVYILESNGSGLLQLRALNNTERLSILSKEVLEPVRITELLQDTIATSRTLLDEHQKRAIHAFEKLTVQDLKPRTDMIDRLACNIM